MCAGHVSPASFADLPVHWCRGVNCSVAGGGPKCLLLLGDPGGATLEVLSNIFAEVIPLFDDEVFHIGGDETQQDTSPGNLCSTANTEALLRNLTRTVERLGKTPARYQDVAFPISNMGAHTIVNTWHGDFLAADAARAGYRSVELTGMYEDHPDPATGSYTNLWQYYPNVDGNLTLDADKARVLGGEVSMWTNHYCAAGQCEPTPDGTERPCAWWLSGDTHNATLDAEFARSVVATVFPKAAVTAGALWRYEPGLSDADLAAAVTAHAERLAARGIAVCPFLTDERCAAIGCHESSHCGVPYTSAAATPPPSVKVDHTCAFS